MAFRPNTTCVVTSQTGYNLHGEAVFAAPRTVPCALVFIEPLNQRTSIRSDLSASKGDADEVKDNGKLLFLPGSGIKVDDKIEFLNYTCIVTGVQAQLDVIGARYDHDSVKIRAYAND